MVGSGSRSQSKSKQEDGSRKVVKVAAKKRVAKDASDSDPKKASPMAPSQTSTTKLLSKTKKKGTAESSSEASHKAVTAESSVDIKKTIDRLDDKGNKRVDDEGGKGQVPETKRGATAKAKETKSKTKPKKSALDPESKKVSQEDAAAKPAMKSKASKASASASASSGSIGAAEGDQVKVFEKAKAQKRSKEEVKKKQEKGEEAPAKVEEPKASRGSKAKEDKPKARGTGRGATPPAAVRGTTTRVTPPKADTEDTDADATENEAPANNIPSATKKKTTSRDATPRETDPEGNISLSKSTKETEFECTAEGESESCPFSVAGLAGTKFVLYFYPKDNTPGCTKCAEDFRDSYADFKKARVEVYGVSQDTLKSHQRFKDKLNLPFQLVSDPHQILHEAFGVLKRKRTHAKDSVKMERSTFIIDADGKVEKEWRGVSPKNHSPVTHFSDSGSRVLPVQIDLTTVETEAVKDLLCRCSRESM